MRLHLGIIGNDISAFKVQLSSITIKANKPIMDSHLQLCDYHSV